MKKGKRIAVEHTRQTNDKAKERLRMKGKWKKKKLWNANTTDGDTVKFRKRLMTERKNGFKWKRKRDEES